MSFNLYNEEQRQAALESFRILDTAPEESFDDLVLIASGICGMTMGAITFVDKDRQWLKSRKGLEGSETSRADAFCSHTILDPNSLLIVEDARTDPRFCDNPMVLEEPHLCFYAGASLVTRDGHALGSICVMDSVPRHLSEQQADTLKALARQVVQLLELRRVSSDLEGMVREQGWYEDHLKQENAYLVQQNRTDPLTGVGNRRAFQDAQDRGQEEECTTWVALIDIDHFKSINDTLGHAKGDEILVGLGAILKKHAKEEETIARLGGEEFVWLLQADTPEDARNRLEVLREDIQNRNDTIPYTVSIGGSTWCGSNPMAIALKQADEALYLAKLSGRNKVNIYTA